MMIIKAFSLFYGLKALFNSAQLSKATTGDMKVNYYLTG
ncbi:hypothetical protein EZS27_009141 [termite gut metagenome]|uniref:Uncharacterized protein n=1 Tax=termite gut metagenome TaxID=433724 RepID=A0A5J4SAW4_9ZZZZ